MRVAAIDIGTNTVLLLVAECNKRGTLTPLLERAAITRLGEGVDRARALATGAIARTVVCLEDYAREVEESGAQRISIVGTSAMRDAAGGEPLLARIHELFGVEPSVLSGEEEARLTFRGALSGLSLAATAQNQVAAVFDIGGGSTEVIIGQLDCSQMPRIGYSRSFDLGSVRLTERFRLADAHGLAQLSAVRSFVAESMASVPPLPEAATPVGVAGTMTTLAAVHLGLDRYDATLVHGARMTAASVEATVSGLAAMTTEGRARIPGMEPKRADVIVAGGLIAVELLKRWGAAEVVISDRGVRWGLAQELCVDSVR